MKILKETRQNIEYVEIVNIFPTYTEISKLEQIGYNVTCILLKNDTEEYWITSQFGKSSGSFYLKELKNLAEYLTQNYNANVKQSLLKSI